MYKPRIRIRFTWDSFFEAELLNPEPDVIFDQNRNIEGYPLRYNYWPGWSKRPFIILNKTHGKLHSR
jgi:hypothetical protein